MNNDEMKSILTASLEFWNGQRIASWPEFDQQIVSKISGMIDLSLQFGVISEAEARELRYIYELGNDE